MTLNFPKLMWDYRSGLALDAMITLITLPFLPIFLFLWIFSNVAVCNFPIPVLPSVFRYGYVFPAYNISRAVRTIVFRTKNDCES